MLGIFSDLLRNVLFLILHVTGSDSFPRPLTAKEERACLEQLKSSDPKIAENARSQLIEHNLRLVAHVMKKYYAMPYDQNDLISIGTIGLIKAIDTFQPEKGIRLSSYAARCVENEILMYFRSARKTAQDVSMHEPIDTDKDGNALSLLDTLASGDNIAEDLDQKISIEKMKRAILEDLTERERTIILLRYGLLPETKPLAQREVAAKLGISRSYVSRIEKKVLNQLRKRIES
ncbi:MAG: RNA polymerase sporulation sigma factor SigK [Oscillospiraceae bacterium]|nr:RNA polymerase sporulation sigma factor SigK [Oscillospiraceae bacterium]